MERRKTMGYFYSLIGMGIGIYMIDKIWVNNTIWQKMVLSSLVIVVILSFDFLAGTIVLLNAIEGMGIAVQFWVEERKLYIVLVILYMILMLGLSIVAWLYCKSDAAKEIFYDNITEFSRQVRNKLGLDGREFTYSFEKNRTIFVIGLKVAQLSVGDELNCYIKQYEDSVKIEGLEVNLYEEDDGLVEIYITKHVRIKRKIRMFEIILFMFNSWNK